MVRLLVALTLGSLPFATDTASAQDSRLSSRFSQPVAGRMASLIEAAGQEGLPTEPLVLRALEGGAKNVAVERILDALGRLRGALRTAKVTLGGSATTVELTTAAAALQAGVPETRLAELHRLRGSLSVTAPLGAYLDLVARGAEPERAWTHVAALARRRAVDADFVRLKPRDIDNGPARTRASSPTIPVNP